VNAFLLELASPDRSRRVENVTFLDVPATDGRTTILPGHQPIICALIAGKGKLRTKDSDVDQEFELGGGVMTVSPDTVRIVTRNAPALRGSS
jgi:F0F1-type ATP synthase epsilon subunit